MTTGTNALSIARMTSPHAWEDPGQRPEFDEFLLVLRGVLCIRTESGMNEVHASQAFHATAGDWVQYSTPFEGGAEYIAVCLPAFSPLTVNRDSV
jgi:hypothetical protein